MTPYYYPRVIERVSTALIDVFNDIKINRFNEDGTIDKIIDVPITHHYNKNFAEFIINTSKVKESRHQVPIMGLRFTGLSRDTSRITQQKFIRNTFDTDRQQYIRDRRPSPWNINFTLSIYCENIIDYLQLIENIITYFDPTLTLSIKEFEKVNIERDIIVTLSDPTLELNDEVNREEHQSYSIDLNLKAASVMYPPMSMAGVIKQINQNVAIDNRVIGSVQNDGISPMTIADYNKAINEIVEEGNIPNSVNVSKIIEQGENYYKLLLSTDSDSIVPLISVPGGSTMVYAEVLITERFNSFQTKISIGDASNQGSIMKFDENNPYFVAKYAITFDKKLNAETAFNIYYNRASATEGTAIITIAWT